MRSLVSYQPSRMLFSLSYHLWPTNNATPKTFFSIFSLSLDFVAFLSAQPSNLRRRVFREKTNSFRSFVNLFQGDLLFDRFAHELKVLRKKNIPFRCLRSFLVAPEMLFFNVYSPDPVIQLREHKISISHQI